MDLVGGGCGLLRQLHFENFVCQNERIGTLRGGARRARPLDPPMVLISDFMSIMSVNDLIQVGCSRQMVNTC